jgi:hypothetical protein
VVEAEGADGDVSEFVLVDLADGTPMPPGTPEALTSSAGPVQVVPG